MKKTKSKQRGGWLNSFVGQPLNYNNFSSYPGVAPHNGGNYYAYNNYPTDPYTANIINERDFSIFPNILFNGSLKGGYVYNNKNKKRGSSKKKQLGGFVYKISKKSKKLKNTLKNNKSKKFFFNKKGGIGPLLSDAATGAQVLGNNMSNVYNTFIGKPSFNSPLPYEDQLKNQHHF